MPQVESFLCNEPLKPELSFQIWESVRREGKLKKDRLCQMYSAERESEDVGMALRLLDILGLVVPTGKGFSIAEVPRGIESLVNDDPQVGFKALVLRRLRELGGDPPDYQQQAHVLLTHQVLAEDKCSGILSTEDQKLVDLVNRKWRENGYHPQSKRGGIKLNRRKFGYWKEIAVFTGLAFPGPTLKQFIPTISPIVGKGMALLFAEDSEQLETQGHAPLEDFVEFLRRRFLYFGVDRTAKYPRFSKVIEALLIGLRNQGIFELINQGDSPVFELSMMRGQSRRVNNIVWRGSNKGVG